MLRLKTHSKKDYFRGHFLVHCKKQLSTEKDKTEFLEDLSDELIDNGRLNLRSIDRYLYLNLDGALDDLKENLAKIESYGVFSNSFTGVLGIDITELTLPNNIDAARYFCSKISSIKYSRADVIILFIDDSRTHSCDRFLEELSKTFEFKSDTPTGIRRKTA